MTNKNIEDVTSAMKTDDTVAIDEAIKTYVTKAEAYKRTAASKEYFNPDGAIHDRALYAEYNQLAAWLCELKCLRFQVSTLLENAWIKKERTECLKEYMSDASNIASVAED